MPIWIGGNSDRALRRVAEYGDGWLATAITDPDVAARCKAKIAAHAEKAGRDPNEIGYQMMLDVPPRDEAGKRFYAELDRVRARAAEVRAMGFGWGALNATAIFQAGARSVDAMVDVLGRAHDAIRSEVGA